MCRAAVVAAVVAAAGCTGPRLTPALSPPQPHRDALLILPGFGYGRADGEGLRTVARAAAPSGIDVYVPRYITRGGLEANRRQLAAFIRDQRLDRYERVHVFAFLAGAWTVNPLVDAGALPNLATIVYDRSPFQERAPLAAVRDLRVPAWLRYGSTIFEMARTPYPPLARPGVKVGVLVETQPTAFVRRHAATVAAAGPLAFDCSALGQPSDDCAFVPMRHDELYARFADVWPDVEAFIHTGRFTDTIVRTPPRDPARLLTEKTR